MFSTAWQMLAQVSPTLAVLIGMSVTALAIGLERSRLIFVHRRRLRHSRHAILKQLHTHQRVMAQAVNRTGPWHLATPIFEMLLSEASVAVTELRRMQKRILRQIRARLWILGSIGSLAPFVGLLGTVIGVMQAFRAIGTQGGGGFQIVSAGLSEALITTAAGIFVGIESMLLFNYLQVCTAAYQADLVECIEEISESVALEKEVTDGSSLAS